MITGLEGVPEQCLVSWLSQCFPLVGSGTKRVRQEPGSEVGTRIPGSLGRVWKKKILPVADEITPGAALMEK